MMAFSLSPDANQMVWPLARRSTIDLLTRFAPNIKGLLTAEQLRKLPPIVASYLEPRYLTGWSTPTPFQPNVPAVVRFSMPDAHHTFQRGHRVMVQVQSSWFPLVDRNPQTFTDIYAVSAADFRRATHRVYRSADRASQITVRVLPAPDVSQQRD